jgi:cystathionine beta-lyase family protein involved in aluminum resistance
LRQPVTQLPHTANIYTNLFAILAIVDSLNNNQLTDLSHNSASDRPAQMQELVAEAIAQLAPTFAAIDLQTKRNLERVLAAFRDHKLGAHHFASVSGYGHDDAGRELLDQVWAQIFDAEAAVVRVQLVSGTHAIACCLFGILRPGDELVSVAGAPYDTLEQVIGHHGSGQGSLREFGVSYRQVDLATTGEIDWQALGTAIQSANPHGINSALLWL